MTDYYDKVENKTDSLLFVLANKPWSALAILLGGLGLFWLGFWLGG